jgi:signal transduction histidine kinase
VNDLGRQILELSDKTDVGTPVDEVLQKHPQLAEILRESFGMSTLPNRAEIELRSRSQAGKTIGFTLSLVPGDEGSPAGAAIFFKDLTIVEQSEERERLRDRLAALGQMAGSLAHEIRNPLASIEVTAALLRRSPVLDSQGRDMVEKIIAEVRRLNATVTSSLAFVKPLSLRLAPCSIETVLEEALAASLERHESPRIRVERLHAKEIPAFQMDRARMRQVFENLFLNALEAMAGGEGVLRVRTEIEGEPTAGSAVPRPAATVATHPQPSFERWVVVRIEDTGAGLPDSQRDRLFYPFFTTKPQGSGVGLSLAKKIVDSHHGWIDAANAPDRGAVFTVRLPMVMEPSGR